MHNAGFMLLHGMGTPVGTQSARQWLKRAADAGLIVLLALADSDRLRLDHPDCTIQAYSLYFRAARLGDARYACTG